MLPLQETAATFVLLSCCSHCAVTSWQFNAGFIGFSSPEYATSTLSKLLLHLSENVFSCWRSESWYFKQARSDWVVVFSGTAGFN